MIHQKTTQNAFAAMSRLAELYSSGTVASSRQIAQSCNLPIPLVGKMLTELCRAGLIVVSPEPGGGYRLAKPPVQISLMDVVGLFERETKGECPFGPAWCGHNHPCPLHEAIVAMNQKIDDFLKKTNFEAFQQAGFKDLSQRTGLSK